SVSTAFQRWRVPEKVNLHAGGAGVGSQFTAHAGNAGTKGLLKMMPSVFVKKAGSRLLECSAVRRGGQTRISPAPARLRTVQATEP
ncbi:hypothetical protein, partial [Salipiger sp. PrR002]|uniref:hypothetical protein n=1 Tax=Salipiger sp. PrR002 TaxID=2706489 RepID=UPI0019417902